VKNTESIAKEEYAPAPAEEEECADESESEWADASEVECEEVCGEGCVAKPSTKAMFSKRIT
jgi:hypothetical protein